MNAARHWIRGPAALGLFLLCAMAVQARAQGAQEWTEVRLLGDRLRVNLPAGAHVVGMDHSIMEAPKPQETEARVFLEVQGRKLVIVASELFQRSNAPMDALGREHAHSLERAFRLAPFGVALGPRKVPGLELAVLSPSTLAPVSDAYLLKAVIARRSDGTLLSLGFFAGEPSTGSEGPVAVVVDGAIGSLLPGERALRGGANVHLEGSPITLDLPDGFTAYSQAGPDFDVYWLVRLAGFGEGWSRLGVYVGNHPQPKSAPPTARAVTAKVFGQEVQWLEWQNSDGIARGEVYVKNLGHGARDGHVFITATSVANRDALLRTITSAKFD